MANDTRRRDAQARTLCVTSALPYANGDIHLGHLVEAVQTDIFVRYQKLMGNRVLYVCADDTHGTPIQINAMKRGITPQQLVSEVYARHVRDYAGFGIGFDIFYTTDSPENRQYAELIYSSLREKGLVEEKEISQYYCEHDRRFLPDRFIKGVCPKCGAADQYGDVCEVCGSTYDPVDLKEPFCITCGKPPVLKSSKHLFVQLSKCEKFLREYILSGSVLAEEMKNFVKTWIDGGLREWCISRDTPYFGFEIPGMPNKYFYVWLDAPIGYLSSTKKWCADHGENVDTFWSETSGSELVHFIGKDIVYFHTLFWPVMLSSAGFKLPSKIFVHGFLTVAGEKMSKSRGTFILAAEYLEKVKHPQAAEYLRFYFGAKLSGTAADIDLNAEEFVNRVNTVLVNNVGNLHHRTMVFCDRSFNSEVPDAPWDEAIAALVEKEGKAIAAEFEAVEYKSVIERVQALGNVGNKYYQDSKPWELVKTDPAAAAKVMVTCANLVRSIMVFLKPIVPQMASRLEQQLGAPLAWQDHLFSLRAKKLGKTEKLVQPIERTQFDALFGIQPAAQQSRATAAEESAGLDISVFKSLDLRIGTVNQAERVEKSQKLMRLQVDIGSQTRQVVAGIAHQYAPEALVGKQVVVVANLKSATLMGQRSDGMLLAALDGAGLALIVPEKAMPAGSKVS
jgi:methionyl-tRNA synthetase